MGGGRLASSPATTFSFLVLIVALEFFVGSSSAFNVTTFSFEEGFSHLFGDKNLVRSSDGRKVKLVLDRYTGSGFISSEAYGFGLFSASIKLPSDYTAGVVVAFYTSNGDTFMKTHDELDFEFLGNIRGKRWKVQTNVYGNGSTSRGREERYFLPFDPTLEAHRYSILWTNTTIIFYVDETPIREVIRSEAMEGDFPSKPMWLYATIWDGSTWATSGGKYKVNYRFSPFTAEFNNLVLKGCPVNPIEQFLVITSFSMDDSLMDKVSAFGGRLMVSGNEVGRKVSDGVNFMSSKVMALFKGQNHAEKVVEEATAETLEGPDWNENLDICDMINHDEINSMELIRGIKRRIMLKNAKVQNLALVLLETVVKNCEKAFSDVAAERVLDEIGKLIDDPRTVVNNRNMALVLIKTWGEMGSELRYLPTFEETYKSLKSRGIRFPGRVNESLVDIFTSSIPEGVAVTSQDQGVDIPVHNYSPVQTKEAFDVARNGIQLLSTVLSSSPQQDVSQDELTATLLQQCHQSQHTIQRIIDTTSDESLMFEALNVNDEIQRAVSRYEKLKKPAAVQSKPEIAIIPVIAEPDASPQFGREDALVRKPTSSRTRRIQEEEQDDDDGILRDLDEMIFGKKGRDSDKNGDYFSL